MNTRGQAAVAGITFIVLIAAFALYLLIVGFIGNTLGTELQEKIGINDEINDSLQTTITISTVTINTLWYVLFAILLLWLIIEAMMAQQYPKVMVPIFILTLIISVIVAIVLANAYEQVYNQTELASASIWQSGIYFIMTKLPYIAVIVGLLAIVIIFTRDGATGGGGGIIN